MLWCSTSTNETSRIVPGGPWKSIHAPQQPNGARGSGRPR
jgi:hypothetical protein